MQVGDVEFHFAGKDHQSAYGPAAWSDKDEKDLNAGDANLRKMLMYLIPNQPPAPTTTPPTPTPETPKPTPTP